MTRWALGWARLWVRLWSAMVPGTYRDRFREEWEGELAHVATTGSPWTIVRMAFGVGADADAARRLHGDEEARGRKQRSPMAFLRDVKFAVRSFARRPWWTGVVLVTLAVGIGANTAMFSLVQAVLFNPLDYPDSDRLVKIVGFDTAEGDRGNLSPADFYDLAAQSKTFSSMGAHGWVGFFTVTGGGAEPERVGGSNVTSGFFETLGVSAALGRVFTEDDDQPEAPPTVVLTHAFWQRRFGADPAVLGRSLQVNAVAHEIIGVLPASYRHPEPNPEREPLLYTLYRFDRSDLSRSGHFIRAVGRLDDGQGIEQARAELKGIAARLSTTYAETNTDRGVALIPLKEAIVADVRRGLLVLFATVGAVLLIACVNIANLQLASSRARARELGIKAALGANRARLVRQLVTESWLLALGGGALGLMVAYAARSSLVIPTLPRSDAIHYDWRVLAFTFVLSSATAILFGLAPALSLSMGNLRASIVDLGERGTTGLSRARRVLVTAEVALSLVLLVGAGLLLKSLSALQSVSPGFRTEEVLAVSMSLPTARYEEGEQIPFYEELYDRLRTAPSVSSLGAINILPLTNNYSTDGFQIDDRPAPEGEAPAAEARSVCVGYFETMGIPLLRGRLFDSHDDVDSPGVVIINEAMANRFWPGADPLGKHITYNRGLPDKDRQEVGGKGSREIIGIVGNVKHLGLDEADVPMFFTPQPHDPSYHTMTLVLRGSGSPEALADLVRHELASMDPEIPVYGVRPLEELVDVAMEAPRFRTYVLGFFAILALGLSLVGVYGVMGVVVTERTHEIGIRMALGARSGDVVRLLIAESMKPVLWGIAMGSFLAVVGARLLGSLLFEVGTLDPEIYVLVATLILMASLTASFLPTQRATRIAPIETLTID